MIVELALGLVTVFSFLSLLKFESLATISLILLIVIPSPSPNSNVTLPISLFIGEEE